jgi:hypothetical protein
MTTTEARPKAIAVTMHNCAVSRINEQVYTGSGWKSRFNGTDMSEPAVCLSVQGSEEEDEDRTSGQGDADGHGKPEEP